MHHQKLIHFKKNNHFLKELNAQLQSMDSHKKTLLFIEPYGAVNALVKRALTRGYQVIAFTAHSDLRVLAPELLESLHMAIQVDTAQEKELRELGQCLGNQWQLDAVLPGFEYFVPSAAQLSRDLRLPGIAPTQVMNLRSKYLMRSLLQKAKVAVPKFIHIHSMQELTEAVKRIGFPAICKPVDAAGSVHVKKVNNLEEAKRAAEVILFGRNSLWGYSLAKSVLLEEYVEGKEYSAEGIIQNGRVFHYSITEKFVADQREFVEIGHIANAPLAAKHKTSIERYLEQVIQVLQADHCPFHAELRLNSKGQPILMEIAARLAGDRIGDLINLARQTNYFDAVLSTYLGEKIDIPKMDNRFAGIRFFYRPWLKSYASIVGLSEAKKNPIEEISFYYANQQAIPAFPKALRRLGHVIMKSDNYDYLASTLARIDKNLFFQEKSV